MQGPGPSARYAHTLSLVANRFLVAMGGNDGKSTLGDAWALDTSEKPYQWRKITDAGEMPSPRCAVPWHLHCDTLSCLSSCKHSCCSLALVWYVLQNVRYSCSAWRWPAAAVWWPRCRWHTPWGCVWVCQAQRWAVGVARCTRCHANRAVPARRNIRWQPAAHLRRSSRRRQDGEWVHKAQARAAACWSGQQV